MDCDRRLGIHQLLDDPVAIAGLRRRLLRFAQRSLTGADAEDATQETLLALLSAPERYDGSAQLETYAHGVLRHKTIDIYRAHGRELLFEPEGLQATLEETETADDPADQLQALSEAQSFWTTLAACMQQLREKPRSMFELRDLLELDLPAACRTLGVTCNYGSVLAHRARADIRRHWLAMQPA